MVLDTAVTPELAAEGLARDLVRAVQQARRDAGLDVSDRIALTIGGSEAVQAAARTHEQLITDETLATSFEVVAGADGEPQVTVSQGLTNADPSILALSSGPEMTGQRTREGQN